MLMFCSVNNKLKNKRKRETASRKKQKKSIIYN